MSVILDALKRVQDENRRQGVDPVVFEPREPVRDTEAMVERLSAPAPVEESVEPARQRRSPVVWVGVIALCSMAVIATALWWFQPDFTGPRANDGRPLLTDQGEQSSIERRVPTAATPAGQPPAARPTSAVAAGTPAAVVNDQAQSSEAPAQADMSDLSEQLPARSTDERAVLDSPSPASREPQIDLTSSRSEPESAAPASGEGFIRLSSSRNEAPAPAATGSTAASDTTASDNPFAERPDRAVDRPASGTLVDPGVRAAFDRGLSLQKAGDAAGAEDAYRRALRLDPNNAKVNANLAVLYEGQGRLQLAERHLREAISVEPQNSAAHNNLGVVLYRLGNYDGAMIEFNRTLAIDAERFDAYINKGLIFMRWGRYDDAERVFRQVLMIDPNNALAHYNLGLVYEEMQRWDLALASYYRFLDTGGTDHPEIVSYLSDRLPWVETRLEAAGAGRD